MIEKKIFVAVTLGLATVLSPVIVSAHPGNTDAKGCHTCRTNCSQWGLKNGQYHCHNPKGVTQPLPQVTSQKGKNGATGITKPVVKPVIKPAVKPIKKAL